MPFLDQFAVTSNKPFSPLPLFIRKAFIMYLITGKVMFENGRGDIINENGNVAIDWEEVNPHNTERLSNFTQYSGKQQLDLDITDP